MFSKIASYNISYRAKFNYILSNAVIGNFVKMYLIL